jgi:hypothetical protein
MGAFVALVLLVGAAVLFARRQNKTQLELHDGRRIGRLLHRRSGEFSSSCSWCKNTALGRKLIMFERSSGTWSSADVMSTLSDCPDELVDRTAAVLVDDQPDWRRFCSEKCANEFFVTEKVVLGESFGACAYCSVRFPERVLRCPNCGAGRAK